MKGFSLILIMLAAGLVFGQELPFTSSNLPIVVINTNGQEIPDEPKITAHIGIINNGPGNRNDIDDPYNDFEGTIGIEIRGSSSQMFPKKQYGFELRDEFGDGIDASLLGLPAEEDWILFAPYNDKSLMRDVLAYKLATDLGHYAPRTRYCEVVLNDVYAGVYVLIEKIKRDNNRVDINKLNPDEISGDNLTGGYIIKLDKIDPDEDGWASSYAPPNRMYGQTIFFIYGTPDAEDIVPEQKQYIQQYVSDFENSLAGSDFRDPDNGYAKYIDVESFIDYFILTEVSKNPDGYRISTFMHKQRDSDGGKLHMGPVWDYNLAFGNVNYCTDGTTAGFVTDFNSICPGDYWLIPFWWDRLIEDPEYQVQLSDRWQSLRAGPYSDAKIDQFIDSIYNLLDAEAQQRNFQTWPVLGEYVWPNYYVGATFQQEVNWLKYWIHERLDWLDQKIPGLVVGIGENASNNFNAVVHPNPFQDNLVIEFPGWQPHRYNIQLVDALGRVVKQEVIDLNNGVREHSIITSDLNNGFYLIRLQNEKGDIKTIKLLKRG